MRTGLTRFLTLAVVLGAIAALTPLPSYPTDASTYERLGRDWFIRGCDDLHCSRVLVPWILGLLPGASMIKWKAAAVLCEAGAAWFMERWALRLGASPRSARQVMWLTALGSGSLYTLFDPHTADPLMHLLAPAVMLLLFTSHVGAAVVVSGVGVFGKEFAAVPLAVAGLTWVQQRRWPEVRSALIGFLLVVALWAVLILALRMAFGYSYGKNPSANLLGGGYLLYWSARLPWSTILPAIALTLGVLWILWPAGLLWGPRTFTQLTLAALPCILVWCYVQQPDRALWNFTFIMMPAAAVILASCTPLVGWGLVAVHALVNLRFGAQLPMAPPARFTFTLAAVLAIIAVWQAGRIDRRRLTAEPIS
jgi:hypothetical protein